MNKRQRKKQRGKLVDFICSISPYDIQGYVLDKEAADKRYDLIRAAFDSTATKEGT